MSDEPQEVEEITAICGGLNINTGTLNKATVESMFCAGKKANELKRVVTLDPVGAGASKLRTETAVDLMKNVKFTAVRGNISEIKTLALGAISTGGVDADVADTVTEENLEDAVKFIKTFAEENEIIVAATGAIDLVSDGKRCFVIRNGRSEMSRVTGTGCQLTAVMNAFLVANENSLLDAAAAAICTMGLAGEIGWELMGAGDGNATYRNRIIDGIYHMSGEALDRGAKYEIK